MADRGMVYRGLECCLRISGGCCTECGYWKDERGNKCTQRLKEDALELLKPVPAETEGDGRNVFWWYVCGECHGHISEGDHYCRHCGRAVKWDA